MRSRFTQCEKVDPQMASIDVLDRSTKASRLQFSQASGPRKLTSDGSLRYSSPDELKLPSGMPRVKGGPGGGLDPPANWVNLTWDNARQLSKTHGEISTPGANSLVSPSLVPMYWACLYLQQFLFGTRSSILQTPYAQIVYTPGEPS